ncbi:MAG TPA: AI-2E family transporter [Terriglobales bacterium]|nr:AI-2E family transporter [Terriglobales bacterium]
MQIFDGRTGRVLATLLLFGLALAFLVLAWRALVTFLFAILFAYLFEPVVEGLQKRLRFTRGWAVAALYGLMVVVLGLFVLTVGPRIVHQATRLADLVPGVTAGVSSGQIAQEVGTQRGWSYETQYRVQQFLAGHRATISAWEREFLGEIASVASNLGWVALIPILAAFFLLSGDRYFDMMLEQLARRRQRVFVANLLHDVHDVLASYIRAQILLTVIALVVYLVAFEMMRLPYAVALATVAGLLEFIPVVGPLLGAVVVVVTSFVANYSLLWLVVIFLGGWRLVQDYFNSPRIMGNQVQLSPLAVLFGVLAGAEVAGVIGVYLSIPVMASLRVAWIRWRSFESAQIVVAPAEAPQAGPVAPSA